MIELTPFEKHLMRIHNKLSPDCEECNSNSSYCLERFRKLNQKNMGKV